jgi:hypothetical protein
MRQYALVVARVLKQPLIFRWILTWRRTLVAYLLGGEGEFEVAEVAGPGSVE